MAHAHHFLSRLDRVSLPEVELALGLYNDTPLLLFILQSVRLPEGAARVAISLGHPEEGPFLVVTREGRFVTCLGEGMSPGELPVITRGQLDGIAAKAGVLRTRMEQAKRLAGPRGGVGKLLQRIHDAGDELSREEIVAISGFQPLYAFEFFKFLTGAASELRETRKVLTAQLKRTDRLKPQFRALLRGYWNTFWSIGHLSVLMAMDGWATLEKMPPAAVEVVPTAPISWMSVREGVTALALRGVWATGRIGKPLLPALKQRLRDANSPLTIIDASMGVGVIGLRHAKLYAEVVKVLSSGPDIDRATPMGAFAHGMVESLLKVVAPEHGAPQDFALMQRALGARMWVDWMAPTPPGSHLRFERPEDVPEDLAMSAAVNIGFQFLEKPSDAIAMFMMLPWVARAAPEQLYLPREAIRARHFPWEPEHTLALLRAHRDTPYQQKAAKKEEGPARKGPCPCGSGEKYKRCCGAEKD
jgi:hypothetical protein